MNVSYVSAVRFVFCEFRVLCVKVVEVKSETAKSDPITICLLFSLSFLFLVSKVVNNIKH